MILTHCGKLGDFLYCLPIAEWLYRNQGRKVHWVLPHGFQPFRSIEALLRLQPHCADVTLVSHALKNLDSGGQPYRFNPADYGVPGDYYNLGFRCYPTKFITEFYAEEHGLGWTRGYWMEIGKVAENGHEILRSNETAMERFAPQATPLPGAEDLLALAQRIAGAKEFHSWYCGLAVLARFSRRGPLHLYRVPGHAPRELYFPDDRDAPLTWHEVAL